MQHFYIFNGLQNEVNSPCEIVVACDGSDAATLYRLDAVAVGGHPVGAVRRTIEGDIT
jgi:ABC-type Fe3+-hydroxamate transport system substrate-binding protein